jgi:hypothetical protein
VKLVDLLVADPSDKLARDQLCTLLSGPKFSRSQLHPDLLAAQKKFLRSAPQIVTDGSGEDLFKWFIVHFCAGLLPDIIIELVTTLGVLVAGLRNEGRPVNLVFYCAKALRLSEAHLKYLYETGLSAVTSSLGAPLAKTQALELGRLYYSTLRKDGTLTIYDEQAIANDIATRS